MLSRSMLALLLLCQSPVLAQGQEQSPGESTMERMLGRMAERLKVREDLRPHVGSGFNRDSAGTAALAGLKRTDDTTVVAWFTGFGEMLTFMDGPACAAMTKGRPTVEGLTAIASAADSTTIARWLGIWETAAVAFFLAPDRPEVDPQAMIAAVLTLMAEMPEASRPMLSGPAGKKKKLNPEEECKSIREFFTLAATLKEPDRTTFFRGLADQLGEPETTGK